MSIVPSRNLSRPWSITNALVVVIGRPVFSFKMLNTNIKDVINCLKLTFCCPCAVVLCSLQFVVCVL